ncbi:MAG: folate-binding protein [Pseudomonadota bacterium]
MTQRRLLRISGPETRSFLQGLVSNDVSKTEQGLVYAAMLSPQGKYLADFFIAADGDALLLDTDAAQSGALAKRLMMYKLRADVEITEDPRIVSTGTGTAPSDSLPDPRHPSLGWRAYGETDISDTTDWTALYVTHEIPSAGIELTPDSYILEMGFERLNGVDFRKGCYVGQEVTARMKHKTELRKGLAKVNIDGQAPSGTEIMTETGKAAGTLYSQSKGNALAYMRFDRATGPLPAGNARITYAP